MPAGKTNPKTETPVLMAGPVRRIYLPVHPVPRGRTHMPIWMQAGLWGLAGATSLLPGAALAYLERFPHCVTTGFMAFGCGVLISAISYDLIQKGFGQAGMLPIVLGALAGSMAYTLANGIITRNNGHDRTRLGGHQRKAAGWPSPPAPFWTGFRNRGFWGRHTGRQRDKPGHVRGHFPVERPRRPVHRRRHEARAFALSRSGLGG